MKNTLLLTILFCLFSAKIIAQDDIAALVANKFAQKMKDSLNLSNQQKNVLLVINYYLNEQKRIARLQHPQTDSISKYVRRIEKQRDSLYQRVLPPEKYILYREKKMNIINNN